MKIGALSKACNVTKDTIRYYVELGLLLPSRETSQMEFSQREKDDLDSIQKLKQLKFTMKEIQAIFSLRRMSNLIEPDTIRAYMDILEKKHHDLQQEIDTLKNAKKMLEMEMKNFSAKKIEMSQRIGVPLRALTYLCCPHCGKNLSLQKADIENKYIQNAELFCDCGYHAFIKNGIVLTGNMYDGKYDLPDTTRGLYRNVGDEFVTGFQMCSDLVMRELRQNELRGKVIMETNINGYFFLYNNFSQLEKDCLYIVTDKYPEMLWMYKELIEMLNLDLDILFIADDSISFPVADGCVDVLIDFFGANEHFLYKKDSYLHSHKRYVKRKGQVVGAIFGFDQDSKSIKKVPELYPECSELALDYKAMLESGEKEGFHMMPEQVSVVTNTYHKYSFKCHENGEKLYLFFYKTIC